MLLSTGWWTSIRSLENIFPHITVFLCDFHREQSWHRYYVNSWSYSFLKTLYFLSKMKAVFKRDFILGEMKYFQFGVWSISYNCLLAIPRNETHCGLFWQKWKQYIQMKSSKTNLHMQIFHKVKDSTWKDQNKQFHFISPAMKTNVNKGLIIEAFFCSINLLRWKMI